MSDTPRTNAAKQNSWEENLPQVVVPAEKMAQLERELNESKVESERWKRQHDIVTDERAGSFAMLSKAIGGVGMTEYQAEVDIEIESRILGLIHERDSLRAINAELEEAGNILRSALHSEFIQEKIAARQKWDKTLTKVKNQKA